LSEPGNKKIEDIYLKIRNIILRTVFSLNRAYTEDDLSGINPKKILVIKLDRIGDMVMTTPIFRALKEKWPEANISVLANTVNSSVIINNPFIDNIFVYDKRGCHKERVKRLSFFNNIREKGFDIVIDPYLDYKLNTAIITRYVGSKYRLGFEFAGKEVLYNIRYPSKVFPLFTETKHVIDFYLGLIECLGVKPGTVQPEIFLTSDEKKNAQRLLTHNGINPERTIIGIHPGGNYESQRWPIERFAAVSDQLIRDYDADVVLFGGPKERLLVSEFRTCAARTPVIFEGLDQREFMSVLSSCSLLLCNNSGPLHIATALNIPTVSTMGPTIPFLWWPRGDNHIVLRKDLDCSPCKKGICATHECMLLITVNDFMDAIIKQLKSLGLSNNKT
jgi:heptosyltransferase-2